MGVLLFSALITFAQTTNTITVTGNIVEEETKEPAIQATVQLLSLPDSTYAAGIATGTQGRFTLPKVKPGNYLLKVSYIGFMPSVTPIQLKANPQTVNVGTISLRSDAIMLQEAVVIAEAPPVKVVEDTVVYAASAYRTAEGAMLEELVKKLPGAEISDDGKITINGKEVKKIMVDGKEFFSDDPQVSMKNLPVNMVENVKAYDRKSDMARITGIDDGDEETVLDLTVKKGMKKGWIGNLITGVGNKDRYEAGGMLNRFLDDSNLSIVGSFNNTNNKGFSEFGESGQGMSGRGGAGTGITTSKSLGINFAQDTKKWQIGGNVQYGYSDNDARMKKSSERFLGEDESSFSNETNSSRRKRHDARANFRIEWRPDSMTTIVFRPNVTYSKTENFSDSWSETLNNSRRLVNNKLGSSSSESDSYSLNGRLELYRKLNSKGRNLSLRGNFGYSDTDTDSYTLSETDFYDETEAIDSTLLIDRYTSRNSDNRNWSVSASYAEPIFKNHFLQLRYEFSHRKRLSESLVYDNLTNSEVYVDSLSSRVENFYDTHSVEASIRGIHPKMMYTAGVTLIPQSSRSETTIGPNASKQLPTQDVLNFAPQAMFRYMFDKQHMLMFQYRGRSSEPNIEDLQEVIDQTDPLNVRYGNPNLKPSFTHNVSMFYNRYIPASMRSYSAHMFYTRTSNSVANKTSYDDVTGALTSHKVNVSGNWNARGFFSFNTPLKNRKYTLSSNSNVQYRDAVSYSSVDRKSGQTEGELTTTHNMILGERVRGNYRTDNFDVSLSASVNYNLTRNNKQTNSNRETFDYYLGGETNVTLPWQLYLSTDMNYRIKSGYSGDFNQNEVIWNAQVSKNLLKNRATIRIKIYDILQEQTNLSRTINETMMSDTEYNTLGSYFMVHFVYKLNTLGGRAPNRGGNRGGPMMGPPPGGGGGFGGGRRQF